MLKEDLFFSLIKESTYDQTLHECISTAGSFGSTCTTQSQCNTDLVCSSVGTYIGHCLYDQNQQQGLCENDNNCANLLFCNLKSGACGCSLPYSDLSAVDGKFLEYMNFKILFFY